MGPKNWKPVVILPGGDTFRQAWNLFLLSSAFAVLFNAFFVDGISLKYKPEKMDHLMDQPRNESAAPSGYAGWDSNGVPAKTPQSHPSKLSPGNVPRLSLMGAKARFDGKSCVFLDARNPGEYKAGHIPGSLNLPAQQMDQYAPQVLPQITDKNREIVAYCEGGDCTLSLEVARTLLQQGYTKVEVFEGGWPEWKKADYPSHTGENP